MTVGKAIFGAEWIGRLTERERWLIKRYIERRRKPSTILPGEIDFVGPGGPIVPVNDRVLATEVERARDRREQMDDQYDQAFDWLEDHGFDCESNRLDLARFERAFAAASSAEMEQVPPPAKSGPGSRSRYRNRRDTAIERQLKALGTPPEALAWKPFCGHGAQGLWSDAQSLRLRR
jgi:hypothetical protein